MDKNYSVSEMWANRIALAAHLGWAASKAEQIDARHAGSILNELSEIEMSLEMALARCKDMRQAVQGHSISMPKGS